MSELVRAVWDAIEYDNEGEADTVLEELAAWFPDDVKGALHDVLLVLAEIK